jgi:tetratricopeptide (TPR) repeat protein
MIIPRNWRTACLLLVGLILTAQCAAQDSASTAEDSVAAKHPAGLPETSGESKFATPLAQGMQLYYQRDLTKAAAKFKEAADPGGPESAAAYAWLSRMQLMLRQSEEAAVSANKALQLDKDLPTAQSAVGEVLYRQGKLTEAQEVFRRIALTGKPDARAYLGLAKVHWATGNYLSAKQVIDRAHALDPDDPEIFSRWLRTLQGTERLPALKSRLASAPKDSPYSKALEHMTEARDNTALQSVPACKLVSTASSTRLGLESLWRGPNQLGGYGIPIKLNDAKANLQVDTGAFGIIVNTRIAQKAGLQRSSDIGLGGIGDNGPLSGYLAHADSITIGDLQFTDCYVQVVEHLRMQDEDGLIATSVLEDFLVDLDFPAKEMRLSPLEPLQDIPSPTLSLHSEMPIKPNLHNRMIPDKYADFEKVYRIGRYLLIPTRVNDSRPELFLLDTGAWDNVIAPGFAREVAKVSESPRKVSGLAGDVKNVYQTDELTLTFGNFQQHRQRLLAIDLKAASNSAETEISGILGFAMLWILDVKLDYRDHLVDFQLDPNRPH